MFAEEAEFHRVDLQRSAVVFAVQVLDKAVLDVRKGDDLGHGLPIRGALFIFGHPSGGSLASRFLAGPDLLFFLFGDVLALQLFFFFLEELFPLLFGQDYLALFRFLAGSGKRRQRLLFVRLFEFLLFRSGEGLLGIFAEDLVHHGVVFALFVDVVQDIVAEVAGKAPLIPEEAQDVEQVQVVGLIVQAEDQQRCQNEHTAADEESSGQIRDEDEDEHGHRDGTHDHVSQHYAAE